VSLRDRMALLFLAFLSLVTISVFATSRVVSDQQKDALVINLAGRQRMLIQQITRAVLQIEDGDADGIHVQEMHNAIDTFDQTLQALISGGQAPYLPDQPVAIPATLQNTIHQELIELQSSWHALQDHLSVIQSTKPASPEFITAIDSIEQASPEIVQRADHIVRLYEADSNRKVTRLRWIQTGFFVSAVGLLIVGLIMIRRDIVKPLRMLADAATRIGQGNLNDPVEHAGPREIATLAQDFDTMRGQLKTAQDELEHRVRQRTHELTALYDVICEISSHLEIDHVLHSVTTKARDLLASEVAFLCLLDRNGQEMTLKAFEGPQDAVCGRCALVKNSLAEHILTHNEAMVCNLHKCRMIAPQYRTSHLASPLRVGDRVIGALCVGGSTRLNYSSEQTRLLTELANSTAIALENARLYEQAERVATLEERQRIAAEMHDGLAQILSYLQLKTGQLASLIGQNQHSQAVQELALIDQALDQANTEARHAIANLQTETPPGQSLQKRLREVIAEFGRTGGPPVESLILEHESLILSPEDATHVSRIVQEALHNTRRHAKARHITICLEHHPTHHCIMIQDDGQGFDLDAPQSNGSGHFGLSIMRARAARLGGKFTIQSEPGQGTRVIISWPAR
jgi:two-component system nitrate/nitrite sensor histidine kinase NarX